MKTKTVKLALEGFGSYLGVQNGCFTVRNKEGKVEKYPMFENEISEVRLHSGNTVSVGALNSLAFWGIDTMLMSGRGRPIAVIRSLEDNSHVSTRIAQYRSLENGKSLIIAKQFVLSKLQGQDKLLSKYGLKRLDLFCISERIKNLEEKDMRSLRTRLTSIEGHFAEKYFEQIFEMFQEFLRPEKRKGFGAFDKLNNLLSLGYEILTWKVYSSLLKARLETHLGYLHSEAWGKPSLVCDFVEFYRYLIDDFTLEYSRILKPKDFILKSENLCGKKGKREYLANEKTTDFMKRLNGYFLTEVKIPRYRVGKKQELETLISEEAMLFAKYLRGEKPIWHPRIVGLS